MSLIEHEFTGVIIEILNHHCDGYGRELLKNCELVQYLNIKTKAANRGSKSRAGFANHYAIYVLVEDYLDGKFNETNKYSEYEGARFSDLFQRQRQLPFGSKLQNHALNHRLNEEFKKYFPTCTHLPIIRDAESNRYWINENLIKTEVHEKIYNLAKAIKEIIEAYIDARRASFLNLCRIARR